MTNIPENPDLPGIAREAQVEIAVVEAIRQEDLGPDDATAAFTTSELGYFEAEITSLRDAATTLNASEHRAQ